MQKKGKQVASSTKWGLGENVAQRLMECLTPTVSFDMFMDNCFTSFHLLTHLGVNNIRVTGVLNKNRLRKCTSTGDKELKKKRNVTALDVHLAKKQCNLCGWLERHQGGLHSFFWIFSTYEICSVLEQSWKNVYWRTTTKSIPLLQVEHGFCKQNGLERGQVQYWYPNEKMFEW